MGWKTGRYTVNLGPASGTQFDFPYVHWGMLPCAERSLPRGDFSACALGTQGSGSRRPSSAGGFLSKPPLFLPPDLYPAGLWPRSAPPAPDPHLPCLASSWPELIFFHFASVPSCSGKEACDSHRGNRAGSVDWFLRSLRVLRYLKPVWTSPLPAPYPFPEPAISGYK